MNYDKIICSSAIFTAEEKEKNADEQNCVAGCVLIKDGLLEAVLDIEQAFREFLPDFHDWREKDSLGRCKLFCEQISQKHPELEIIDESEHLITPGLIDSHTHLVHGGNRANELLWKLQGKDYMQIRELGGGIVSTVKATREASFEELKEKAAKTLRSMLVHGTTTLEAKSGYGLDRDTELRQLKVVEELNKEQPINLVSTFMGAHDIPPEYKERPKAYGDFIIEEMLPLVKKENLAEFVDIFCEKGIFEVEETERIAKAALELGFKLKIHADEIYDIGGTALACKLKAVSAEHLMAISDENIELMGKSDTVAVLLPATSYFLMVKDFAPAGKMLAKNVKVAIASDYNPGSSPCENLQTAMSRACFNMRMKPDDILRAVTINAAKALSRENNIGSLAKGKKANICVFNAANPAELFYHFGINAIKDVYIDGILRVKNRIICE